MKTLIIYHAGCWDGFCAAWLFSKAFPDAEFVSANYGEPPPSVVGCEVFVVDFSYERDVMKRLCREAAGVTVLDHHKTAQAELEHLAEECHRETIRAPLITFDMDKSGGRLAWEHLCAYQRIVDRFIEQGLSPLHCGLCRDVAPWLVDYTEDRDLWRHKLPNSKEVNASLRTLPLEFAAWDLLHIASNLQAMAVEGAAILRREKKIIDDHLRHARGTQIGGYVVPCVNATVLFSDIAGELAKGKPFGACYFDRGDGRRVYSLRSTPQGLDVAEIAKKYGGGGHKHAAGFQVDSVTLFEVSL